MSFNSIRTLVFLCASLVAPISAFGQEQQPATAAPASDAATLALLDTAGKRRSLDEYRGKIVVLNFWATWCVPCREEMPLLVALRRRYLARGVEVVGASADDESTRSKVEPFMREARIDFPVWTGAATADMQRFGLGSALPATALLDRDGRIAFRIVGPLKASDLSERLEWLLGERRGAQPAVSLNRIEPHSHEGEAKRERGAGEDEHHDKDKKHDEHQHEGEEEHEHGGVGIEGASTVPS
ncbi:MAG TPA: TlpA disulfide reductase family protein [Pyrinomonadaceae bacterium]|jgi:thiol-disulfide isomerase/thioredoxin